MRGGPRPRREASVPVGLYLVACRVVGALRVEAEYELERHVAVGRLQRSRACGYVSLARSASSSAACHEVGLVEDDQVGARQLSASQLVRGRRDLVEPGRVDER